MKKITLLLFFLAPSVLFAESKNHPILPGVHFGMPVATASSVLGEFVVHNSFAGSGPLRTRLIISTQIHPGKMTAADKGVPIHFQMNQVEGAYMGKLDTLFIFSNSQPANGYESLRTAWADFKDIADSKFPRLGGPGTFPEMAEFGEASKDITTDAYEVEGVHVDLIARSFKLESGAISYSVFLKITEAIPTPAAAK